MNRKSDRCLIAGYRPMYGVPEELDLAPFLGTALDSIVVDKYQLQFVFTDDPWTGKKCVVAVEGQWEMRDAQSALIDKAVLHDERDAYKIHLLLSRTVASAKIAPPRSFTFVFDNGWTLTFVDDSTQYESCHLYVDDSEIHI